MACISRARAQSLAALTSSAKADAKLNPEACRRIRARAMKQSSSYALAAGQEGEARMPASSMLVGRRGSAREGQVEGRGRRGRGLLTGVHAGGDETVLERSALGHVGLEGAHGTRNRYPLLGSLAPDA